MLVRGGRVRDPYSRLPHPLPTAVWNFPRTSEHHLPLQIGETVHILQASEGKGVRQPWPDPTLSPAGESSGWGPGCTLTLGLHAPSLGRAAGRHPALPCRGLSGP